MCGCPKNKNGDPPCHYCKARKGFDHDGDCYHCWKPRDDYMCPNPRYVKVGKFVISTTPLTFPEPNDHDQETTTMPSDIDRYDSAPSRKARETIKIREMTRVQRRIALEPHFTTIWVSSWLVSVVLFIASIWTDGLGFEFSMTGLIFAAAGGASAIAKGIHQETNVKLEGVIENRNSRPGY